MRLYGVSRRRGDVGEAGAVRWRWRPRWSAMADAVARGKSGEGIAGSGKGEAGASGARLGPGRLSLTGFGGLRWKAPAEWGPAQGQVSRLYWPEVAVEAVRELIHSEREKDR